VKGVRNVEHLNRTIAPFFIRRRKEEVASDLPDKYYDTRWVDLYPQQRKAYNQMAKKMLAWVGENEDQPVPAPVEVTRLMRLQQFAVSGIEVVKTTKRIRNKHFDPRLPEVNPSLHAEVMSLILAKRWGPARKFNWRVADVPVVVYQMTDPSSKLDYLVDMMKDMDLDANPLVVFTQFRRATTLLAHRLERAKITYGIVTGDSSKASRDQVVEDFQAGSTQVFVGTIGACRESITLTRSSHVVFVDRAWSPSWNRQAEDRLHRIGQENAVQVTDLIAKGTVDLGRHSSYKLKWTWLQQMFGDKVLDYQTHLLEGKAA
jgi:SNF2 family DNA or RNA helicase